MKENNYLVKANLEYVFPFKSSRKIQPCIDLANTCAFKNISLYFLKLT